MRNQNRFWMHIVMWWALAAALLAVATSALAQQGPPFPRVGALRISPQNYDELPELREELGQFDTVILPFWRTWNSGRDMTMDEVIQDIKANGRPGRTPKVFLYQKSGELNDNVGESDYSDQQLIDKVNTMNWWLRHNGNRVPSHYKPESFDTVNETDKTPNDPSGKNWMVWHADWLKTHFVDVNPSLDGLFQDNMFPAPRKAGDWDRDGTTETEEQDPRPSELVGSWLKAGMVQKINRLRSQTGRLQIANVADWANSIDSNNVASASPEYLGVTDGGLIEKIIGIDSWSAENTKSWSVILARYRETMRLAGGPKLVMFHTSGDPDGYQMMRYGLATTLMDDGYFVYSADMNGDDTGDYNNSIWFDEFSVDLGYPTQAPPTTAWQSGVWRRDFDNGIVLVNPKGNGTRTVNVGSGFKHFQGTQDPTRNNNEVVTSVTLQARDGVILLRTSPPTEPPLGGTRFGRTDVGSTASGGMTADRKRGSKFTLSEAGTLQKFTAYLDGLGGVSGSQGLRMALYRDAGGLPDTKVAESQVVNITSGSAARWVDFAAINATPLTAGDYWIVIHSGSTGGIARSYGGPGSNWWGNNTDAFDDGPSDTFGSGNSGTGPLSVNVTYTTGTPGSTFGETQIGSTPSGGMTADRKRGSKFTLSENGTLQKFTAYLDGQGGTSGTQGVRMALYQDNAGVPGAKVAESQVVNITSGSAAQWVDFTATSTPALTAGNYWIVIHSGGTSGVARNYTGSTQNWWGNNTDAFSDGASDPFGSGNSGTGPLSVYVTYAPATVLLQFGRTDVSEIPSGGMTADRKRGSRFTLSEAGTLQKFTAYLDGEGGLTGTQSVRMVLYRNNAGLPGQKVAESNVVNISSGSAAQWVDFTATSAAALTPGDYWIVIHSGGTGGVARNYGGDGSSNWWGNSVDTFSDGASDPFGSGNSGTGVLCVYVTYQPSG